MTTLIMTVLVCFALTGCISPNEYTITNGCKERWILEYPPKGKEIGLLVEQRPRTEEEILNEKIRILEALKTEVKYLLEMNILITDMRLMMMAPPHMLPPKKPKE